MGKKLKIMTLLTHRRIQANATSQNVVKFLKFPNKFLVEIEFLILQ